MWKWKAVNEKRENLFIRNEKIGYKINKQQIDERNDRKSGRTVNKSVTIGIERIQDI